MLKTPKRAWVRRALLTLFVLTGICLAASASSYLRECIKQEWNLPSGVQNQDNLLILYAMIDNASVLIGCLGFAFDQNANDIVAFGTLIIGVSTLFLWDTTRQTTQLAREEFVATHRPRIIFHTFEQSTDEGGGIGLHIDYVNAGSTDARIVRAESSIFFIDSSIRPGARMTETAALKNKILSSGERGTWLVESDITRFGPAIEEMRKARGQSARRLTCIGQITYTDVAGAERRTGFCRCYDAGLDVWKRVKNRNYEYSY